MDKLRLFARSGCIVSILLMVAGISWGTTIDRLLATVNSEIITISDYRRFVTKIDPLADKENVNDRMLKKLIEEKIILHEAVKSGFSVSDEEVKSSIEDFRKVNGFTIEEFEKRLADEGMNLDEYKNLLKENLISLKLIDKDVNSKVLITDKDISDYYEKNKHLFMESSERVLVKAIFMKLGASPSLTEITDLKIRSLKIHAEIKRGESFDKLVMIYTDDSLKARDGILGEFERGTLLPSLDEKIFSLKEGDVSDPVWTKEGVYILKALKITPPKYVSIEESKDRIIAQLHEQKREEIYNEWMKKLWEKYSVKIIR